MLYSVKGFIEINEDMVQILLMFEVLSTQDFKVEVKSLERVIFFIHWIYILLDYQLMDNKSFIDESKAFTYVIRRK